MSVAFLFAGLIFLAVAYLMQKLHRDFLASSRTVTGKVVEIVEEKRKAGSHTTYVHVPYVEYEAGATYHFKSEIDARQHQLEVGAQVKVLISKDNPRVARLKLASREKALLIRIFYVLGVAGCLLAVHLFDPSDFSTGFLGEPTFWLALGFAGWICVTRGLPHVRMMLAQGLRYHENASEVGTAGQSRVGAPRSR